MQSTVCQIQVHGERLYPIRLIAEEAKRVPEDTYRVRLVQYWSDQETYSVLERPVLLALQHLRGAAVIYKCRLADDYTKP